MTALVCHDHIASRMLCILCLRTQIGQVKTGMVLREQSKSLIDFNDSKPQTNMEQTTDIDEVAFSKLQIRQSDPREELLEMTKSLIPPPPATEVPEKAKENTNREELSEVEKKLQREEEQYELYDKIHMGQLSNKEESNTDTDSLTYTYFG